MWSNIPAPEELVTLQSWMSKAVITPPGSPQKQQFQDEAVHYITGSQCLSPAERLEIYCSDFWPRCEESFRDDFPGLVRLWGDEKFLEWITSYILSVPSQSFTLFHLPAKWTAFLEAHYHDSDRDMVLDISRFEWALCEAFFNAEKPCFQPSLIPAHTIATTPLSLQPFIHLISGQYDIFTWWENEFESPQPEPKPTYTIVYRSSGKVMAEKMDKRCYTFLQTFSKPHSIEAAIEAFSESSDSEELPAWIQTSVQNGWLYALTL